MDQLWHLAATWYALLTGQPPFAVAPWNGNKSEWDVAIRTRNQNQNEYKRTH